MPAVLFPAVVFAQNIVPTIVPNCDGTNCTICHLAELAQNLLNAGIFIAVFLSALLFAYAGFNYMTKQTMGEMANAKNILTNVVIGLVIILGAWLVVDTLMKTLMGDSGGNWGPWNSICK